jgi:hypothetical protein
MHFPVVSMKFIYTEMFMDLTRNEIKVERKIREIFLLIFCTPHMHALCKLKSQHTPTSEAHFTCTSAIYHTASNPLLVTVFAEPTGLVGVADQGSTGTVGQLA